MYSDVTLGRTWLTQMGAAAAKHGITIQYCMAPSRAALQSLEIPVVTQVTSGSSLPCPQAGRSTRIVLLGVNIVTLKT